MIASIDQDCILVRWKRPPSVAAMRHLYARLGPYTARENATREAVYLAIIEDATSFPDDAARHLMAKLMGRLQIERVALVVPEDGFRGAIIRSIITASEITSRLRGTQRVFREVLPAVNWLAGGRPSLAGTLHEQLDRLAS